MTSDNRRWHDRRQNALRRMDYRRDSVYRTRREWTIAEFLVGVVSCAVGITGISGGLVTDTLRLTQNNMPWFLFFYGTGGAFIVLSFCESRCRSHRCSRETLIGYAYVRFAVHIVNFFCWTMGFLWLHLSGPNIAAVYYESIPLAVVNFWAMIEHAKALWLNPYQAKTTSMVAAMLSYLRGALWGSR